MILLGIGDEAGARLETQLAATAELGWQQIELRAAELPGHPKANFHELPEAAFAAAVQQIEAAGLHAYCFGSAIMNWAKQIHDPFEITLGEVRRCVPRMQRLGSKLVRIMSFKPGAEEYRIPGEVFRRVKDVTNMLLDAGIQPLHENCMNYGGMSWQHTLELLDRCPGLKLVFDTANPVFNPDRSRPRPWPRQDAWEFWTHVRDHVAHLHIKDARWDAAAQRETYCWPGEGQGYVREILQDARRRGYQAGLSIEPHMVTVFHAATAAAAPHAAPDAARKNFVAYGQRVAALLTE